MRGFRIFAAAMLALSASALVASGKDKDKKDTPKEQKFDPANRTALSKQMAAVVEGNAKYNEKDFAAALEAYKRATQLAPNDPLGPYLVAEAELAQGNIANAEASLAQAEKIADKRPDIMGKVLFLEADAKERQKKWADAKAGWLRYKEWSDKHLEAGVVPQTAAARIQAIDDAMKQDQTYEEVRKRIAEEKLDAGKADSGK
jgi:tetratricopeptide (TPR) repeat protein